MVVVEGVGRALDPMLDIWKTAEPVVREWITRNLGVIGRTEQAGRGALSFAQAVAALPSLVNRTEHLAETLTERLERGFPLDQGSIQAIGRAEGRSNSAGHLALWAIAIMIGLALFWI